ncbi:MULTISPECIES: restriction endonuclease subunit S [Pectobacterium]|uniref:restriction endonuclease subunit S n=1 Tax=Pectobacterium TaxID=122277 RepID=UPI000EB0B907|nr:MULTISPECIES: restriction endonuclease subunit S [Pectobacterium]AYH07329.1 restriction endonuclease subunit S [Pectobacterium parmentieri]
MISTNSCNWMELKIGDIADVVSGGTPKAGNPENFKEPGTGIAWLTPADLSGYTGKYISFGARDLSRQGYYSSSAKILPKGSLLFSSRAPIGYVAIAQNEISTNQGFKSFVFHYGVDPDYAYHYLKSIKDVAERMGTGTTFKEISGTTAKMLPFILPPLAEQKVIAEKLDALLAQVEVTKARLERIPNILKCLRQSVIEVAVSGNLTKDWRKVALAQWKKLKLLDVIQGKPRNGYSPKSVGHETPYRNLTLSATTSGRFVDNQYKYIDLDIDSSSYLWVKHGDILIQRANTIDYVGVSAIYEGEDNQYVYPDLMMKCIPNIEKILGRYLHLALSSKDVRKYFRDNATGTSGSMPKINQQVVSNAPIYLPPLDEQQEIVRRVEEFFTFADHLEEKINSALAKVNNLTQSILVKAFRGELTAEWRAANPMLIGGENSANALLEKIKAKREAVERQPKPKRSFIKMKAGSRMRKKIIKVVEALEQAGEPLSGQQLLAATGYPSDSNTGLLEQFFLDIRDALAIEKSIVKLERDDDGQDWFALAQPATNE